MAQFRQFVLVNEERQSAMAWYESTLSVGQVFKEQPTTIAHFHNDDGKPRTNTDDDPPINHTGDEAPARLQLGGKRWEHVRNVERIERELDLANLTIETKKKCLRCVQTEKSSRFQLNADEREQCVLISGHTHAVFQIRSVHDPMKLKKERILSVDNHQYGKNSDGTGPRHDIVLIKWENGQGEHSMGKYRVGRVFLFSHLSSTDFVTTEMAYVEWFMLVQSASTPWNSKTEMFKVRKSPGEFAVIDVRTI